MMETPNIARIASLIGDPARATMLSTLMNGYALTATELALGAGITAQTASAHLAKLVDGGLLMVEKQGRHRYFRLTGSDVAHAIEGLTGLAARTGLARVRPGPKDEALRRARICYDHLAGDAGVQLLDRLEARQLMVKTEDSLSMTDAGRHFFTDFGIDVGTLESGRRPPCRTCLDWSERRHHMGGRLGAELLRRFFDLRWADRIPGSRVVKFSTTGQRAWVEFTSQ
jgi:DNA-binding transcriptional ArsR family regulator